jgi:hypothetical protein
VLGLCLCSSIQECCAGYYVSPAGVVTLTAANAAQQECLSCVKGEECVTAPCVTCSPCQPGYYKAAVATDPCAPCPANTYVEVSSGSSALSSCLSCQARSSTSAGGQSSRRACACEKEYYLITSNPGTPGETFSCPKGAVCGEDGECALRNSDADLVAALASTSSRRVLPSVLQHRVRLCSLVPLVWESNPKLQVARPNHQADRGSDPNHRGIWSPPRAGFGDH